MKKRRRYDADIQEWLRKYNFDGLEPCVLEARLGMSLFLKDIFPDCSDIPIGDGVVTRVEMPGFRDDCQEVVVVWYRHEDRERKLVREITVNVILVAKEQEL